MQCPNCALYHPSRYEQCVSCGSKLVADAELVPGTGSSTVGSAPQQQQRHAERAPHDRAPQQPRKGMPTALGIAIAGFILCASAGGTFFYLTKAPESDRLYNEGEKQLKDGQYAFALKTLGEAQRAKPNDPKVLLALARAYVGVDQVDKAWECITQAQQMGAGVVADASLASELANYYRQHNNYERAVDLLRPLAANNIAGKKGELSDLDAAWGDEALRDGDFKQAMKCWEEVNDLHEGSRFSEAQTRLSTIYQKIGEQMAAKGDDEEALRYYTKLNTLAPSGNSFERTAELYQKEGKLELAIDQMRQSVKLSADPTASNRKLAAMMSQRGKELLDSGDADSGYGYLQQAQALDKSIKAPSATIRNAHLDIQPGGIVHFTGEVWNPGPDALSAMTVRAELFDTKGGRSLWVRDQRVVDEFVPPLPQHETRAFELTSGAPAADPNSTELRISLNGVLYKSYNLGGKQSASDKLLETSGAKTETPVLKPRLTAPVSTESMPPTAPNVVPPDASMPRTAPSTVPGTAPVPAIPSGVSPEEKTLKDLD